MNDELSHQRLHLKEIHSHFHQVKTTYKYHCTLTSHPGSQEDTCNFLSRDHSGPDSRFYTGIDNHLRRFHLCRVCHICREKKCNVKYFVFKKCGYDGVDVEVLLARKMTRHRQAPAIDVNCTLVQSSQGHSVNTLQFPGYMALCFCILGKPPDSDDHNNLLDSAGHSEGRSILVHTHHTGHPV